jgi:hypothetical protein
MADFGLSSWLMLASGAVSAAGAVAQGNAQAAQNNAAAAAANYNANMQRQQAATVGQQTSSREDLQRKQARQIIARQVAAGAESGVNITTGSAADLFRQSLYDAEMDALNIRYEGELNRVGLLNQASLSDWEAGVSRSNAKSAKKAGRLNAVVSLASGAAGAYGAAGTSGAFADKAGAIGSGSASGSGTAGAWKATRTITGGR